HDGGGHDGAGHATAHEQAQVGRLESGEPEAAVDGAHADGDSHPPESHAPSGHAGSHTTPHATPDATAGAGWARATGHAHGPVDSTPPTAAQRAAADELLRASHATMPRYALASVARADGYRVVHDDGGTLLHYLNPAYARDGREVVAQRIESLLYVVVPGGGELLVGGMYTVPKGRHGPAVGGSLTPWHAHDDLCLHPAQGIALTQLPGGGCPPGSAVGTTGEMMHVWAIDYPGGPFGELDAVALRTAVLRLYGIADAT
ncbi:MAG: rane protein of unknown function, partial [Frankiales bacterium]|nr:rane protein of unknown function [Frankiales bacterium]